MDSPDWRIWAIQPGRAVRPGWIAQIRQWVSVAQPKPIGFPMKPVGFMGETHWFPHETHWFHGETNGFRLRNRKPLADLGCPARTYGASWMDIPDWRIWAIQPGRAVRPGWLGPRWLHSNIEPLAPSRLDASSRVASSGSMFYKRAVWSSKLPVCQTSSHMASSGSMFEPLDAMWLDVFP